MGRPSKFKKKAKDRIVAKLAAGETRANAAKMGGVTYQALLQWLRKGEKAKKGEYYDFYVRVMEAEVEAREAWFDKVNNGWSEPSVKQIKKGGLVVEEQTNIKQKQIDPLRWLALRYPHEFGQNAVKELSADEVIERFFDIIEERHGKSYADRHKDLYDQGVAGESLKAEDDGSQRNPFRKPIMGE